MGDQLSGLIQQLLARSHGIEGSGFDRQLREASGGVFSASRSQKSAMSANGPLPSPSRISTISFTVAGPTPRMDASPYRTAPCSPTFSSTVNEVFDTLMSGGNTSMPRFFASEIHLWTRSGAPANESSIPTKYSMG